MGAEESYDTKVYTLQGGDVFGIKSDGIFKVQDGEITAQDLKRVLIDKEESVVIGQGTDSTVFSIVNQPYDTRFITLSLTSNLATGSFWLTSCVAGAEVYLHLGAGSTQSGAVTVSTSGCTILGSVGLDISLFTMNNSSVSTAGIHLVALKENVWSVISEFGDIDG
jgi:hypothetical protein